MVWNQDFGVLDERRSEDEGDEESRLGRGTGRGPFSRVGNCGENLTITSSANAQQKCTCTPTLMFITDYMTKLD